MMNKLQILYKMKLKIKVRQYIMIKKKIKELLNKAKQKIIIQIKINLSQEIKQKEIKIAFAFKGLSFFSFLLAY